MSGGLSVLWVGSLEAAESTERALERVAEAVSLSVERSSEAAIDRLGVSAGDTTTDVRSPSLVPGPSPPVDCVVTSHDPPDVNAIDLLESVRTTYPTLPVVVFPADGTERLASEAVSRGVTEYVPDQDSADSFDRLARRIVDAVSEWRTEREELEHVQFQSDLLEDIFEQVPAHLYVKDTDARYLYVSECYLDEDEEPWGKTDLEEYPEEFARPAYEDDLRVIQEGERIINKEEWAGFANAWNITSKVPWRGDDGGINGLIGITRQITEHKAYEEALERQNERLERFASVVSHDLRNPLNVATGNLTLVREECDSEFVDPAIDSLERMDRIIEDVLTMARSGRELDEIRPVSLSNLVERCWESVDTADAELIVEDDLQFQADFPRLQRAMENLLRNSVEHGGEDVTIRVGTLEPNGFFVEDDGPGIPEDVQPNVFDPGFSTGQVGIGLGLNIVMEIVQAHGWEISVTDGDLGGARFEITGLGGPRL